MTEAPKVLTLDVTHLNMPGSRRTDVSAKENLFGIGERCRRAMVFALSAGSPILVQSGHALPAPASPAIGKHLSNIHRQAFHRHEADVPKVADAARFALGVRGNEPPRASRAWRPKAQQEM